MWLCNLIFIKFVDLCKLRRRDESCKTRCWNQMVILFAVPIQPEGRGLTQSFLGPSSRNGGRISFTTWCFFLKMTIFKINLFIFVFGCAGSSLLARAFSSFGKQGLLLLVVHWTSHCSGFSCCRTQALELGGFSSCSTWSQ